MDAIPALALQTRGRFVSPWISINKISGR